MDPRLRGDDMFHGDGMIRGDDIFMFGISFSEIILICAVALVVLGPKQLPGVASRIGLIIYSIKNYFTSLKHEIYYNSGVGELINTKNELMKTYSQVRSQISPHNKIENDATPIVFKLTEEQSQQNLEPYQPELEFNRQPELFDIPVMLEQIEVPMKQRATGTRPSPTMSRQGAMRNIGASI
jgi:sec-independent protein translocase protein TatB